MYLKVYMVSYSFSCTDFPRKLKEKKLFSKLLTMGKAQIREMVCFAGMSECLVRCT